MNNYDYCIQFVLQEAAGAPVRVLDHGCGTGQVVRALRQRGVDAVGCDPFDGGGATLESTPLDLRGSVLCRMENGLIPFQDASFDLVLSNQVLEHVDDVELALSELERVLRPGGKVLCLYPDEGVWWEGHSRLPFFHRFGKENRWRRPYATCLRALGMGSSKKGLPWREWSRTTCEYLDRWTHYRAEAEVKAAFERRFEGLEHLEADWFLHRLDGTRLAPAGSLLPRFARRAIARKVGGVVMVCRKPVIASAVTAA